MNCPDRKSEAPIKWSDALRGMPASKVVRGPERAHASHCQFDKDFEAARDGNAWTNDF